MSEEALNTVTWVSVILIIIAFIMARAYIARQKKNDKIMEKRRWIDQLPSLISTLGVLGTFIGITIGLWFFDTDDLDNSIPKLLSGLKTAFFTSLAGMLGSLWLSKIVSASFDERDGGISDASQASVEICRAVGELRTQIKEQGQEQSRFYSKMALWLERIVSGADVLVESRKSIESVTISVHSLLEVAKTQDNALKEINVKAAGVQKSLDTLAQNSITQEQVKNIIDKGGILIRT